MSAGRSRLGIGAMVLVAGMLLAPVASSAAELTAELRPARIYLGTQTLLIVEVTGAENSAWPSVQGVDGIEVERYRGPSVTWDMSTGKQSRQFQFIVTPSRAGRFEIPSVSLRVGGTVLKDGPFVLQVGEVALAFYTAKIDPTEILVGQTATLEVYYQGVRPGVEPVVPTVDGLVIRPKEIGRVEVSRREGLPYTIHSFDVEAKRLGTFEVGGITFDGVPADPVTLKVASFVVVGAQVSESSLVVGSRTTAHVLMRGLPESAEVKLVAPAGVRITPSQQRYQARMTGSVFSFDVVALEPGNFTVDTLALPSGEQVKLDPPLTLAVRQAGEGGIFACRGTPSSEETVVGEPFTVDYEVFFRGDLQDAAIDLSPTVFAGKAYIKVESVNNPDYADWQGSPIDGWVGEARMRMLLGGGEYDGQKEQVLRFSLRFTPLAAGELSLDGLRVVLRLLVKEERRTANSYFSSSQTKQFARVADVPSHNVIDPPGITRPATYQGAVGRSFAFVTELDRTSATAMSPLTLTMKITGESVGAQFTPPPLTQIPELTRDFDVSPTVHGGEVTDDTITFTQVVRPRSEEVKELPALPLVYYDYAQRAYETVYSLPIPLEVRPGRLVGAAAMEAGSTPATAPGEQPVRRVQTTPAVSLGANYTTLGHVVVAPLSVAGVVALLIAGPVGVVVAVVGRWAYRRRQPLAAVRQQKRALVGALDQLKGADEFYVRLADVLQSYLRLTFDLPAGEISAGALAAAFERARVSGTLRDEARDLFDTCDAGRFASGAVTDVDRARLIERARELIRALDRSSR